MCTCLVRAAGGGEKGERGGGRERDVRGKDSIELVCADRCACTAALRSRGKKTSKVTTINNNTIRPGAE